MLPDVDRAIAGLKAEMEDELRRSSLSEAVRDGFRVVLAGCPNTGKSSLLNALARRDAAIVSAIPGTTRDAIEVMLDVGGLPVILTDTAGLRAEAADAVEVEGIRRSLLHVKHADALLWVTAPDVEGSAKWSGERRPDLVVETKCDLNLPETRLNRNESDRPYHKRVHRAQAREFGIARGHF